MLEYPEIHSIANQMKQVLIGKTIQMIDFPGAERKFVFSKQTQQDFQEQMLRTSIKHIEATGNHLFLFTDHETVLNIGDTGGKLLYHEHEKTIPKRFDLRIDFTDETYLTMSVQMWGFFSAYSTEEARAHQQKILDEARDPFAEEITAENFLSWLAAWKEASKVNTKKFIISRKYITGVGNGYTQDILWRAKLHPRRKMNTLSKSEGSNLIKAFQKVVHEALEQNGRNTERDFFNQPGQFTVAMGRKTLGKPCPVCGTEIIKFAFEGGTCYICPSCQPDPRK